MRLERWRQRAAWTTMVGLILLTGLRAQADDAAKSDTAEKKESVQVRELRVTQTKDSDGKDIEERSIVLAIDPTASAEAAADALELAIDDPAIGGANTDRVTRTLRIDAAPAGDILTVHTEEDAQTQEVGKYWIGVQINEVQPALRVQLNLEEGQGVLVGEVMPDSPAAKAGIKQYDIILNVGDKAVKEAKEVLDAVKAADGKEIKLKLLRGGSERSVTVTPAERPESKNPGARSFEARTHVLRDWVQRVQPGLAADVIGESPNLQFNLIRPGPAMVLPSTDVAAFAMTSSDMPEGLRITVTREGKNPARISIKQKERDIEISEDKLNELPEDLRRYVAPMLGKPPRAALNLRSARVARPPLVPSAPHQPGAAPQPVQPPQPGAPQPVPPRQPGQPGRPPQAGGDVIIPAPPGQEGPRVRMRAYPSDPLAGGVERRIQDLERRLEELQRAVRGRDEAKRDDSK